MKYYSTTKIDKKNATYNVIFGERSNGKTFALLCKSVEQYVKHGTHSAYIRRWKEDITGARASALYQGLIENGKIAEITDGEYQGVYYYAGKYFLCNYDDNGKAVYNPTEDIFAYCFALSDTEHNKSTSYPKVNLVIFDEFLTSRLYLNEEFTLFMNTISTIVRRRQNVKIYMLGNTVNRFCPYFTEMGLDNVTKMKQGTIDLYRYGTSDLTVAVEYCASTDVEGETNKYFAFNNPKLQMITSGAWELSIYPHLPMKYKPNDVLATFYIDFDDRLFQGNVIGVDGVYFIYIHNKTTPLREDNYDTVYALDPDPRLNYNVSVYRPINKLQNRIKWFFDNNRVFYQDNEVGDSISNFLKLCRKR